MKQVMLSTTQSIVMADWLQKHLVYAVDAEPKRKTAFHYQPGVEINLTCSGKGVLRVGENNFPLVAGTVVIIPDGVPHGLVAETRGTYVRSVLCVAPGEKDSRPLVRALAAALRDKLFQTPLAFYLEEGDARLLREMISQIALEWSMRLDRWEEVVFASALRLLAIVKRFAGRSRGLAPSGGQRAKEIAAYLAARLDEDLSASQVAGHFGMSREHLSRLFRHHFGMTYHDYVLHKRLEAARQLLARSKKEANILEIALAVGFRSHAHFSRVFRKVEGVTPSQYRLLHHL